MLATHGAKVRGAPFMGVSHGVYCLGCCWALMLLLFAGGVMNLVVILSLTAWVAIEKLAPFGRQTCALACGASRRRGLDADALMASSAQA